METYHEWAKYFPHELQHRKNPSYIDAATYKLDDLYRQFCYFDINLKIVQTSKYEGMDQKSYLFMKYMYYQNALFYINNCVDYYWQMLYLAFQPDREALYDHTVLEKLLETEALTSVVDNQIKLLFTLNKADASYEKIKELKITIEKFIADKEIRSRYNYIKHRGVFYIDGLGSNDKNAFEQYGITAKILLYDENKEIDCLPKAKIHREKLDLDKAIEDLNEMKKQFIDSVNGTIEVIIPTNYICQNGGFADFINNFDFPFDIEIDTSILE